MIKIHIIIIILNLVIIIIAIIMCIVVKNLMINMILIENNHMKINYKKYTNKIKKLTKNMIIIIWNLWIIQIIITIRK